VTIATHPPGGKSCRITPPPNQNEPDRRAGAGGGLRGARGVLALLAAALLVSTPALGAAPPTPTTAPPTTAPPTTAPPTTAPPTTAPPTTAPPTTAPPTTAPPTTAPPATSAAKAVTSGGVDYTDFKVTMSGLIPGGV
jgi:hypothetical protein